MKRKMEVTADGSQTFFVPGLEEYYHSIHGAVTESLHIFIEAGFNAFSGRSVKVLEFGFGSGLNALLTYRQAIINKREVFYHAIEKYPLTTDESKMLRLPDIMNDLQAVYQEIHNCSWEKQVPVNASFTLFKEKNDFRTIQINQTFDIIYFDAFSPEVQPELWTGEMFKTIYELAAEQAILTTYSSKGTVKRNLRDAGFKVEKLPGPPGKIEFIRARKI
ncbi:tRNA (5-methylaminomethyl-2-thiouridine)(34)-methyltransferase MnmD [Bacteroidota bacterium]